MFYLIYTSAARQSLQLEDLKDILTKARESNRRNGITGLLLYKNGRFMQLIEGEEVVVHELMDKIKSDNRHSGILVLQSEYAKSRQFPNWSMAFRSPDDARASTLSDPAEIAFTEETLTQHSTHVTKLLHLFDKHI